MPETPASRQNTAEVAKENRAAAREQREAADTDVLYRFAGGYDTTGQPLEWLPAEPGTAAMPGANAGDPDIPAVPGEYPVPARDLTRADYRALSPANKKRVREARRNGWTEEKPLLLYEPVESGDG